MVVAAYGLYIPPRLLEQSLWLNVHPSLLPRWRGAAPVERAILEGDARDRRDDPSHRRRARRRPDRAREAFEVGELDAGDVFARPGRSRRGCSPPCSTSRSFEPQDEDGVDVRREDRPRRPPARSRRSARRLAAGAGALAAHRRVDDAARSSRHDLEGPPRRRCVRPGRRAAGRARTDELRRVPARRALIAPARRAAFEVVRRVFEEDAYADRALAACRRRARRPRPRARATTRVRDGAAQAHDRLRDRAARQAPRAQARSSGADGAASRRLPARLDRPGGARGRRRLGRARSRRRSRASRAVHERRHAPPLAGPAGSRRLAARRAGQALLPGLDRRGLDARLRRRGRSRADARAERAAGARGSRGRAGR